MIQIWRGFYDPWSGYQQKYGPRQTMWQHHGMITFHTLPDDHPNLVHSPMLRAALLTLQNTREHRSIGLTKTMAFKRIFVHWAVEHFDWPGSGAEEMFRYNKVINEYEFLPLELLHFLLIKLRLARHFKGEFRLTKRGTELAEAPRLRGCSSQNLFPSSSSRSTMPPIFDLKRPRLESGIFG